MLNFFKKQACFSAIKLGRSAFAISLLEALNSQEKEEAFLLAAEYGQLDIVQHLARDIGWHYRALQQASRNGQIEVLDYLMDQKQYHPVHLSQNTILPAASAGQADLVAHLLQKPGIIPCVERNAPLMCAARNGHIEVVHCLLSSEVVRRERRFDSLVMMAMHNPALFDYLAIHEKAMIMNDIHLVMRNKTRCLDYLKRLEKIEDYSEADWSAILLNAIFGQPEETVMLLLGLERVEAVLLDQGTAMLQAAIRHKSFKIVKILLEEKNISPSIEDIKLAQHYDDNIASFLQEWTQNDPAIQVELLEVMQKEVQDYENSISENGSESSMDRILEKQAKEQKEQLDRKYKSDDHSESMAILRRLVFESLADHLAEQGDDLSVKKRAFLLSNMDILIAGDKDTCIQASDYFTDNDDIYEIAFRALNPYAPTLSEWPNLLTSNSEAGQWVQAYAGNIAREIENSKGMPHYQECLLSLIDRLAEIRRAHNEGSPNGPDDPSCYPGCKSRLFKVLMSHPDHSHLSRASEKEIIYEGASDYIQKVFQDILTVLGKDMETAEHLLDALITLNLENAPAIKAGVPVMMSGGDARVYDSSYSEARFNFIKKMNGMLEAVNERLIANGREPMSDGASSAIYLGFLQKALGESWVTQKLSEAYAAYLRKQTSLELKKLTFRPSAAQEAQGKARDLQRQRQALRGQFYDYQEEKYPGAELPAMQVKIFFEDLEYIPATEAQRKALFENAIREIAQYPDESTLQIRLPRRT